jgi:uncharacterized protein YdeI (YjbR/CyaY-like superfamily)
MPPRFFKSPADFRAWLARNHASASELWVGFYRKDSGKGGLTYSDALDEALCFGWIDGVRKRVDAVSFMQRFSPRTPKSIWSAVNLKRVAALTKAGRMDAVGLQVFRDRDVQRSKLYSYERKQSQLEEGLLRRFRSYATAWRFFEAQAPSYQRTVTWWIMSAKKEETRCRRLDILIAGSESGRRLGLLTPQKQPR